MMNGDLLHEEALHLARRVEKEAGSGRGAQVERLFEIALNRPPDKEEQRRFATFGGSLEAICRVVLNSNEFLYVD